MPADEILTRFFTLMNRREAEGLGALLAEDARFDFPKAPPLEGRARILKFLKLLWRRFPTLQFETLGAVAEGESAAVRWRNRGEDRQGDPYENEGVTWFRFDGELVVELSDYFKDTGKF